MSFEIESDNHKLFPKSYNTQEREKKELDENEYG
jgi:hypothetical protein